MCAFPGPFAPIPVSPRIRTPLVLISLQFFLLLSTVDDPPPETRLRSGGIQAARRVLARFCVNKQRKALCFPAIGMFCNWLRCLSFDAACTEEAELYLFHSLKDEESHPYKGSGCMNRRASPLSFGFGGTTQIRLATSVLLGLGRTLTLSVSWVGITGRDCKCKDLT